MARLPRLTVPGYPHLIVQRGNNRQPIVLDDEDRRVFLDHLRAAARDHRVALHAYVLLPEQVQLLATPETEDGVPKMMQALGRHYVRHFNRRHARTGTLWDGRYRSSVLEAERHLLDAMAQIELAPVHAGLVARPDAYAWSSHAHHAGQRVDPLVTSHAMYWALGDTPFAREQAYVGLLGQALLHPAEVMGTEPGPKMPLGWAQGSAPFIAELERKVTRRVVKGRPGRPRRLPKSE